MSSRKRAIENSTFWNESSAASSDVARVNAPAGGRRPMTRANRRYDSPSDVALSGEVYPLEPKKMSFKRVTFAEERVPAEDEECFRVFRGNLGTGLESKN